jgi:hypothetical protein
MPSPFIKTLKKIFRIKNKQSKITDTQINTDTDMAELMNRVRQLESLNSNNDDQDRVLTKEEFHRNLEAQISQQLNDKLKIALDEAKKDIDLVDTNNDGIISQEEITNYLKNKMEKETLENNKEVLKWKNAYDQLLIKYEKLDKSKRNKLKESNNLVNEYDNNILKTSFISDKVVDEFVDSLINDPKINIKYIPDSIERSFYRNVVMSILGSISNMLSGTKINMLGHVILMYMVPNTNINNNEPLSFDIKDQQNVKNDNNSDSDSECDVNNLPKTGILKQIFDSIKSFTYLN